MYDRTDGDRTLTFDFGTGLIKDNLLVVDRETTSVWSQLHGQAISGPLQGKPMKVLATLQTTWGFWRSLHPETSVLEMPGVRQRPYRYRSPSSKRGAKQHDFSQLGLGLALGDDKLFLGVEWLWSRPSPIKLTLGGKQISVYSEPDALTAWAEDAGGKLLPGVMAYRAGWLDFHPSSRLKELEPPMLQVRFLVNAGFLLRHGLDVLVIDAFVAEPYGPYGSLPAASVDQLMQQAGPFDSLDLVLTSHHHSDHFQAEPARRFLQQSAPALFASSPQVIAGLALGEQNKTSVRAFFPGPAMEMQLEHAGIRIDFLNLSHGSGRFAGVDNMGHVLQLGGVTALHVGDAAMLESNFESYKLEQRGIDVVFVPYWYFNDPSGQKIIERFFRPAKLVACHIPPAELKAVREQLEESFPGVIVPANYLELHSFGDLN